MFKPLPADPALIQKLRIRNRIASLASIGTLILWPISNSFIPVGSGDAYLQFALLQPFIGLALGILLIPASVFFFGHAMRYRNLLRYLSMNPPVYAATEPAPTDLSQLRSKKVMAIVWHGITLGVPVAFIALGSTANGDKAAMISFLFLGSVLFMFAITGGLALSVTSINGYLSLKAKLRWAYPDSQAWRPASTSKSS
jgi:hypothetical protein